MRAPVLKLVVGLAALGGAGAYLALAASSGWVYYRSVDEYVAGAGVGRARVHGTVGPGPEVDRAGLAARFTLVGEERELVVEYRGAVPDLFAEGKPVVVEGERDGDGPFRADLIMTKCASKYEAGSAQGGGAP
ncbi:MAG: cytochrome c maturation protein CcmE [Phycisphaerales bacterium]